MLYVWFDVINILKRQLFERVIQSYNIDLFQTNINKS